MAARYLCVGLLPADRRGDGYRGKRGHSDCRATDNALTPEEDAAGWILLFDGESLDERMTDTGEPSRRPIEEGGINPHKSGAYMVVHKKVWPASTSQAERPPSKMLT